MEEITMERQEIYVGLSKYDDGRQGIVAVDRDTVDNYGFQFALAMYSGESSDEYFVDSFDSDRDDIDAKQETIQKMVCEAFDGLTRIEIPGAEVAVLDGKEFDSVEAFSKKAEQLGFLVSPDFDDVIASEYIDYQDEFMDDIDDLENELFGSDDGSIDEFMFGDVDDSDWDIEDTEF